GIARAYQVGICVAESFEPGVDFTASTARVDDPFKLLIICLADAHAQTIVCEDIQLLNVIGCHPGHDRMRAAGVVANHPTQRTPGMSCRIRSKCELMLLRGVAQGIENNARLHACESFLWVDFNDLMHVLGHVDDHCNVAALSGEAGACATQEQRGSVAA